MPGCTFNIYTGGMGEGFNLGIWQFLANQPVIYIKVNRSGLTGCVSVIA